MPQQDSIGAVLVDTDYKQLIAERRLTLPQKESISSKVIQPDSLDLYLGKKPIYRVNGIPDLSGGFNFPIFRERYQRGPTLKFSPKSDKRRVGLERLGVYITELGHHISLADNESAFANARSSIGRTDILCLMLGKGCTQFNILPRGYKGKLWLIIIPQSFSIYLLPFTSLIQQRVYRGERVFLDNTQLKLLHQRGELICNPKPFEPIIQDNKLLLRLDLSGTPSNLVSGDRGEPILIKSDHPIDPHKFLFEKHLDNHGLLWLEPGQFAITRTIEIANTPEFTCATMQEYDAGNGEFRSHYAGFGGRGFRGRYMCEIRNLGTVPLGLSHGMIIASLTYEYLSREPETQFEKTSSGERYSDQKGITLPGWFTPW